MILGQIDLDVLREQILSHPNLEFNAVRFMFPGLRLAESRLFDNTFQNSPDSTHFVYTDVCECNKCKQFDIWCNHPAISYSDDARHEYAAIQKAELENSFWIGPRYNTVKKCQIIAAHQETNITGFGSLKASRQE